MRGPLLKVIAVVGVTASGKSRLAARIASHFGGEVVNADAYQAYVGMDVGTNKTPATIRGAVPHHLFDIVKTSEPWDVSIFQKVAREAVDAIAAKGTLPVICGGTGLYVNALVKDYSFLPEQKGTDYSALSNEQLHCLLLKKDPAAAGKIHANNRRRTIKALDFVLGNKVLKSEHDNASSRFFYDCLFIFLDPPAAERNRIIVERAKLMVSNGWREEALALAAADPLFAQRPASRAIGYAAALDGTLDASQVARQTVAYCRRQRSWFLHKNPGRTLVIKDFASDASFEIARQAIENFLQPSHSQGVSQ